MDDCFTESLVYSDSENSEEEAKKIPKPPVNTYTHSFSSDEEELVDTFPTEDRKENPKEDSYESDDDNLIVSKKLKKTKKILNSDDENSKSDSDPHRAEDNESANEKGSTKSDSDQNGSNKTKHYSALKSIIRPSICDSESSSEEDAAKESLSKKKILIKKFKKLKEKPKKEKPKTDKPKKEKLKKNKPKKEKKPRNIASDRSGSESDHDELPKKSNKSANNKKHSSGGSSNSGSSGSDSGSSKEQDENAPVQPREKPVQRMSAKAAEEQMKEIQSESQRLLREAYIDIPYHKPKQHSLKEFLSRRSIVQQKEELNNLKPKKTAAAIKMSEEELFAYAKRLEEREKESIEFFKVDDSDLDSDQNEPANETEQEKIKDTVIEATKCQEINNEPMTSATENTTTDIDPTQNETLNALDEAMEITNPTVDNIDENSVEQAIEMTESFNVVELHTEQTELDNELDKMIAKDQRKSRLEAVLSVVPLSVPKLSGNSGMVIDLETNELKPKEKSGVDILVERFVKNAIVKSVNTESQEIGIFHTESGSIETHKLLFSNDDKPPKKEPKPGESYLKLKSELSRKINEKRREAVYKRLEEEKKQKQTESDEEEVLSDEFEEYSDCEMATEDTVETENGESVTAQTDNDKDNENDIALFGSENRASENESSESEISDNESELCNIEPSIGTKERRRILTALDDDSDDEKAAEEDPTVKESQDIQPKGTQDDFALSDINRSHDTDDILAFGLLTGSLDTMKAPEASKLYEDNNEEIGESQLMGLCSGTFATQFPDKTVGSQKSVEPIENMGDVKDSTDIETSASIHNILSSDEEEANYETATEPNKKDKKKKKKEKKQALVYSDDSDEESERPNTFNDNSEPSGDEEEQVTDMEDEEAEDEENVPEKYIEYDSDENEIEVVLKKDEVTKKASNFVENEAELSESEWGSADEDEKDIDNEYEKELGDTDVFDESKIHSELERIRLRQQIDQDAREIRILTEQFIEEEDDGHERERKFRWKHLNNTDINDQSQSADPEPENNHIGSDDENEEDWRRQRYEREQKLKEQTEKDTTIGAEANISTSTTNGNVPVTENTSLRCISITKPSATPKISSSFLINSTALTSGHMSRKSFLNRDTTTLAKLAGLTKTGSDGEAIINTKRKGNYVFVATEKKNESKRKSECELDNNGASSTELSNPCKKSKLAPQIGPVKLRPQTKTFLDLLSK